MSASQSDEGVQSLVSLVFFFVVVFFKIFAGALHGDCVGKVTISQSEKLFLAHTSIGPYAVTKTIK